MICPNCGVNNDKVLDSRWRQKLKYIYRKRECLGCGYRWTTREIIIGEEDPGKDALSMQLMLLKEMSGRQLLKYRGARLDKFIGEMKEIDNFLVDKEYKKNAYS